ncbi:MAG: shikimate kinase [Aquificae bacterium]|nr:shikimate kinase [Aquificota bacterium]
MSNIYLVGFMCSGKTTIGKLLSKETGLKFVDIDKLIEEETKTEIADIFKNYGEEYFRQLEKEKMKEISQKKGLIVSTGGGLGADIENMNLMKKTGTVIWLKVSLDTVLKRCINDKTRPILNLPKDKLTQLFKERETIYKLADFKIDTEKQTPEDTVKEITFLLKLAGIL